METGELPEEAGIMVLPNAILFPQALLPLYIFEPRYREMLKLALEGDRMFAVTNGNGTGEPRRVSGIGLIRACVDQPDGTSNLMLQGISRVRFTEFTQTEPYYRARVEFLPTQDKEDDTTQKLGEQLRQQIIGLRQGATGKTKDMLKFLGEVEDLDSLADIVAYSMVPEMEVKQRLLEAVDLPERLELLLKAIEDLSLEDGNFYFS